MLLTMLIQDFTKPSLGSLRTSQGTVRALWRDSCLRQSDVSRKELRGALPWSRPDAKGEIAVVWICYETEQSTRLFCGMDICDLLRCDGVREDWDRSWEGWTASDDSHPPAIRVQKPQRRKLQETIHAQALYWRQGRGSKLSEEWGNRLAFAKANGSKLE